eukprot:CAMPEP_0183311060 /NCGR_PEP_ID=MMETSP0160_2-20130417/35002_1 /TAXON_ID=2839 ORGANISM="Odontella Sinensis, Strain Grunow 1884" /NCGR_SAMPLE_ID=MMETSP0160_2 /ASSEMBLY_ACC=CAM_ASM_000250 /LENGTH=84 /DNA_ID=CAMNT_0025475529 /DNA_START=179 /DNA_END=430 /DNA_ORIENTATION=+
MIAVGDVEAVVDLPESGIADEPAVAYILRMKLLDPIRVRSVRAVLQELDQVLVYLREAQLLALAHHPSLMRSSSSSGLDAVRSG